MSKKKKSKMNVSSTTVFPFTLPAQNKYFVSATVTRQNWLNRIFGGETFLAEVHGIITASADKLISNEISEKIKSRFFEYNQVFVKILVLTKL